MKSRSGFVSNSSSTSFTITNTSDHGVDLVDFVRENPQLIARFCDEYDWHKPEDGYNQDALVKSAEENNFQWQPKESRMCTFGDEDGTLIGQVFDYILRDGGVSDHFEWSFLEYNR